MSEEVPSPPRSVSHRLGAHTRDTGGIHMAVRRAGRSGMTALQVFTAVPKFYNEKISVRPERVARFRDALAATGIAGENIVAHAAYVLNVATTDDARWARAAAGLKKEVERATLLGIGGVCFHPGSSGDGDRDVAAQRVATAMQGALDGAGGCRLLVENTAGAGRTMGKTAEEVGAILSHLTPEVRGRAGYGLDTCHLFSSGYNIAESPRQLVAILDQFESACGEPPSFFHLNDSEGALGSNRDRHMLIGEGAIGAEPFRWLLQDRRTQAVPLILETPQQEVELSDDDDAPDEYDLRMMALLRSFLPGDSLPPIAL